MSDYEIITDGGRRRRWSSSEKLRIVEVIWDDSTLPSLSTPSDYTVAADSSTQEGSSENDVPVQDDATMRKSNHYTQRAKVGLRALLGGPKEKATKRGRD